MEVQAEKLASDFKTKRFWADIFAEFLGTGFLIYLVSYATGAGCVAADKATGDCCCLQTALVYGIGSATLIHWTEGVLNPAIAVAFISTGNLPVCKGVLFIVMEIIGGMAGAALSYALSPEETRLKLTLGDTSLADGITTIQGLFIEFVLTFILTLAVYAARDPGRKCQGYDGPLAYGLAVTVCYLVGCKSTSCGINPSRSFGPAVVRQITGIGKPRSEWGYHWIYWIGPIGGALLAGVTYHFLYAQPFTEFEVFHSNGTRKRRQREDETIL